MDESDASKALLIAQSELIAQGFVEQDNDGFLRLTNAGVKEAESLLLAMSQKNVVLITGYITSYK